MLKGSSLRAPGLLSQRGNLDSQIVKSFGSGRFVGGFFIKDAAPVVTRCHNLAPSVRLLKVGKREISPTAGGDA
jgi:hypothetical protein